MNEQNQKPKINQLVGVGNSKRKPIPIGLYWGIYHAREFPDNNHVLVRIPKYIKVDNRKILKKLHLTYIGATLVILPLKLMRICNDSDKIKTSRNRRGTSNSL
jgi:hypothetical protein